VFCACETLFFNVFCVAKVVIKFVFRLLIGGTPSRRRPAILNKLRHAAFSTRSVFFSPPTVIARVMRL
jgi:hypothetical protein